MMDTSDAQDDFEPKEPKPKPTSSNSGAKVGCGIVSLLLVLVLAGISSIFSVPYSSTGNWGPDIGGALAMLAFIPVILVAGLVLMIVLIVKRGNKD